MLREVASGTEAERRDAIRWRGGQVSRMESLTDGMFGFAITLLVVSLEVPATFDETLRRLSGFFAFAFCFALMLWVWAAHNRYCRRFGLDDPLTVLLNFALVFVVLAFVYPLKFVSLGFVAHVMQMLGREPGANAPRIRPEEIPLLFAIYGVGLALVFGLLALLYGNAQRRAKSLDLRDSERTAIRLEINRYVALGTLGLTSAIAALVSRNILIAGYLYMLIGPIEWTFGVRSAKLPRAVVGGESGGPAGFGHPGLGGRHSVGNLRTDDHADSKRD